MEFQKINKSFLKIKWILSKITIEKIILRNGMVKNRWCGPSLYGDKYKDLIDNAFKSRLKDGDSRLTEFHNWKLALTNVANNYLEKRSWCGW